MKYQNVMEEDWDYLLILDACRYDYFKELYEGYLEGELEKRNSGASSTLEWLSKTFDNGMNHNISYFSGNAYINSRGLSLEDLGAKYPWKATDHFGLIVDVWDEGWDSEYQTVLPKTMFKYLEKHPSLDRVIMHFVQPHYPYLHPRYSIEYGTFDNRGMIKKDNKIDKNRKGESKRFYETKNFYEKIKKYIFEYYLNKNINKNIPRYRIRKIANKIIDLPERGTFERIYRNYNFKEIKNFYKYNLRVVLEEISKNKNIFDGKVIITSDHGECLGEHNLLGHPSRTHVKELTEVPWFTLKS